MEEGAYLARISAVPSEPPAPTEDVGQEMRMVMPEQVEGVPFPLMGLAQTGAGSTEVLENKSAYFLTNIICSTHFH